MADPNVKTVTLHTAKDFAKDIIAANLLEQAIRLKHELEFNKNKKKLKSYVTDAKSFFFAGELTISAEKFQ